MIILFIIHDNIVCISKRDAQQKIIDNIDPSGAQLISIELNNINFNDHISADIINLTHFDFIQQPHLQQRLPIQLRQALLHHQPQHRLDHHCDHHCQQHHQHLVGIREEDHRQQTGDQQEEKDDISEADIEDFNDNNFIEQLKSQLVQQHLDHQELLHSYQHLQQQLTAAQAAQQEHQVQQGPLQHQECQSAHQHQAVQVEQLHQQHRKCQHRSVQTDRQHLADHLQQLHRHICENIRQSISNNINQAHPDHRHCLLHHG